MPTGQLIKIFHSDQQDTQEPIFHPSALIYQTLENKKEYKKRFKEDRCNKKYLPIVRI